MAGAPAGGPDVAGTDAPCAIATAFTTYRFRETLLGHFIPRWSLAERWATGV